MSALATGFELGAGVMFLVGYWLMLRMRARYEALARSAEQQWYLADTCRRAAEARERRAMMREEEP